MGDATKMDIIRSILRPFIWLGIIQVHVSEDKLDVQSCGAKIVLQRRFRLSRTVNAGAWAYRKHRKLMEQSFNQLLLAARQGSQSALSDLLIPHHPAIVILAQNMLGKDLLKFMEAEDLAQEVFLSATASFPNFRGEDDKALFAWLKGICKNTFLAFLRDRAPKIRSTLSLNQPALNQPASDSSSAFDAAALQTSIFGRVEKRHHQSQFERALQWLPESDRQLLIRKHLGESEVSWKSLVDEFGMTEEALRKRGSRLVELLRSAVKLIEKIDHRRIPEPLAELIYLKFLQRLSVAEIAAKAGEPVEKVEGFLKATESLLRDL